MDYNPPLRFPGSMSRNALEKYEAFFVANQFIGYLLIVLSVLLYTVCGAALLAMVYALTVSTTLAAIESAFGSIVIGFIFFALAKTTFRAGKRKIAGEENLGQE